MTFHTDFWVVAGTAASVIALSSILVNGDVYQTYTQLARITGKTSGPVPMFKWPYSAITFWYFLALAVTYFQAFALYFSFMSLLQEHDYASTQLVAFGEFFSLFILGATTLTSIQLRNRNKHIEEVHSPPPKSGISSHPFRKPQSNAYRRSNRYRSSHQIANARQASRAPRARK
jgi:hypothetical protein